MTTKNRYGRAKVKFNATDPVFQDILIREIDGETEYWHPQLDQWTDLPEEWQSKVRWGNQD